MVAFTTERGNPNKIGFNLIYINLKIYPAVPYHMYILQLPSMDYIKNIPIPILFFNFLFSIRIHILIHICIHNSHIIFSVPIPTSHSQSVSIFMSISISIPFPFSHPLFPTLFLSSFSYFPSPLFCQHRRLVVRSNWLLWPTLQASGNAQIDCCGQHCRPVVRSN